MLGGDADCPGGEFVASCPFAGDDQQRGKQRAKKYPHARAEQALLNRIAHEEDAAERQRQTADPHHPLGAKLFFQRRRWWRGRRRSNRRNGSCWFNGGRFRRGRFDDGGWLDDGSGHGGRFGRGRQWRDCLARLKRGETPLQLPHLVACADRHHQCDDGNDREGHQQQNAEYD